MAKEMPAEVDEAVVEEVEVAEIEIENVDLNQRERSYAGEHL